MVLLPQGDIFATGTAVSGSKRSGGHCWKYCPYSTQTVGYNADARVPNGEKVYHSETEGFMHSYSISGIMGWTCADNDCPFFTGDATTAVPQAGVKFAPPTGQTACPTDFPTLSGSVITSTKDRTIVSGTRYIEI